MQTENQKLKPINTQANTIPIGIALLLLVSICQYQNYKEMTAAGHWISTQAVITRLEMKI
jgi:hypothetical protein